MYRKPGPAAVWRTRLCLLVVDKRPLTSTHLVTPNAYVMRRVANPFTLKGDVHNFAVAGSVHCNAFETKPPLQRVHARWQIHGLFDGASLAHPQQPVPCAHWTRSIIHAAIPFRRKPESTSGARRYPFQIQTRGGLATLRHYRLASDRHRRPLDVHRENRRLRESTVANAVDRLRVLRIRCQPR